MTHHYKKTPGWTRQGCAVGQTWYNSSRCWEKEGLQVVTRLSCTIIAISYCHCSVSVFEGGNSIFSTNYTVSFSTFRWVPRVSTPGIQIISLPRKAPETDLSLPSQVRRARWTHWGISCVLSLLVLFCVSFFIPNFVLYFVPILPPIYFPNPICEV